MYYLLMILISELIKNKIFIIFFVINQNTQKTKKILLTHQI